MSHTPTDALTKTSIVTTMIPNGTEFKQYFIYFFYYQITLSEVLSRNKKKLFVTAKECKNRRILIIVLNWKIFLYQ
jgi:hypothetical protein